jgi:signal transduction histidine kinase/ActR/RegA family two-component response regulator
MAFFANLSIRKKLNLVIVLTISVALILACAAFLSYDRYTYHQTLRDRLESLARIISSGATTPLTEDDAATTQLMLQILISKNDIAQGAILRPDGTIYASYQRDGEPLELIERDAPFLLLDEQISLYHPISMYDDRGTIFLRADLSEQQKRESRFGLIVATVLVGSFLVVYVVALSVQRIISRPILQLTDVVHRVTTNRDYSVRAVRTTEDEVGVLVDGFNDMLAGIHDRDLALQKAKDELELRVEEQTRDHLSTNEQLKKEVRERERTEAALKERDEQLRQAQKLEAIGKLAGGIVHDFNNQLAIIQGYMDMALEDVSKDFRIHQYLSQACKAIGKSTTLIDQLLTFSSRQPIDKRPLKVNYLVSDFQKMMGRLLGEDISVELDLGEELWSILADPGNVDQVLTNLFVNARDAMPDGGTLTIQTRNVEIDKAYCLQVTDAHPGRFICLNISDTGTGMNEEVSNHLFEPFFSTKEPHKGTGLGLSVVYGILQSHDGWITVESEIEVGSSFSIYMPAVDMLGKPSGGEYLTVPLRNFRGNGERILLVEDEPDLKEMTRRALVEQGYVVAACGTLAEANEAFENPDETFDAVLSDVVLPDGRGPDLVMDLVERQPDLAALLVTGYTDERGDWQRVRSAGFALLKKPMPMAFLLEHLKSAIDKRAETKA